MVMSASPSVARGPVDEVTVFEALRDVADPEIPAISIVDLGLVHEIVVTREKLRVELLPTFVGCPALDMIRGAVEARLARLGPPVEVVFSFAVPWTSDRISSEGRERLRRSGFAPPTAQLAEAPTLLTLDVPVPCPYCGSRRTRLDNAFGPTQCRSIRYCTECRQPFESFKPV
jgi:ring-1,2-phenylacetyl-CoA epoxidase subunit PaaD